MTKPTTIDDVLFDLVEAAASYTHNVMAEEADFLQAEALATIEQLVLERVIGRDGTYVENDGDVDVFKLAGWCDKLRAEQRQALKQLLGNNSDAKWDREHD